MRGVGCAVFLFTALLPTGCGRPRVENGWVRYPEAGVELRMEEGWSALKVTRVPLPVIAAAEDHGIEPNLFPKQWIEASPEKALEVFMDGAAAEDPELNVTASAPRRVEIGTVWKGLPLARVHYAIHGDGGTLILSGTCAAATRATHVPAFDRMAASARVPGP